MASSSSPMPLSFGPNSTYAEVNGDQKNYTFVFHQVQVIRQRLSSIDKLPPGSREELIDISNCLADVVVSIGHRHQRLQSSELKREIQDQIETAVALNNRLSLREASKADGGDTENIKSARHTVYTLGSYAHFFEDPSADQDLASSLENLINGPLAQSRYPYPMGPARESTYSFHFHPPLPPTQITNPSVPIDNGDKHFRNGQSFELSSALPDANTEQLLFCGSLSLEEAKLKADNFYAQSNALGLQGQKDQALDAIEASVSLYRELARYEPEKFNEGLCRSLFKLYKRLQNQDYERALEAIQELVAINRSLPKNHPANYNALLAQSLFSLHNCLRRMCRLKEGLPIIQETVLLYRELSEFERIPLETCRGIRKSLRLPSRFESGRRGAYFQSGSCRNLPKARKRSTRRI